MIAILRGVLTILAAGLLLASCRTVVKEPVKEIRSVGVEEFRKIIKDTSVVLIDVRTVGEFAEGHIDGALNFDVRDSLFVDNVLSAVPAYKEVALYCRSGRRSLMAGEQLIGSGYSVINLEGGFLEWSAE